MKLASLNILIAGILSVISFSSCSSSKKSSVSNMVARMEVKEPIAGVCDNSNVIAILPFPGNGQVNAKCQKSNEQIALELNSRVVFLKDKPDYEDKGMVNMIVNCKGEMVRCHIDNETKSSELDSQIVAVFSELKVWVPGKVNDRIVDTVVLVSFTISKGVIILS